jgi:hypothetical protein
VISELKSLQAGGFAESFHRKFAELLGNLLSNAWPQYVAWARGITVRDVDGKPEDARFLGVEPTLAKIAIKYK